MEGEGHLASAKLPLSALHRRNWEFCSNVLLQYDYLNIMVSEQHIVYIFDVVLCTIALPNYPLQLRA